MQQQLVKMYSVTFIVIVIAIIVSLTIYNCFYNQLLSAINYVIYTHNIIIYVLTECCRSLLNTELWCCIVTIVMLHALY